MFACLQGPGLSLELAHAFSPRVEQIAADTLVVDIRGLDRLLGSPAQAARAIAGRAAALGISANIAVAANPDAAVHAARGFAGVIVIPPGEEAGVLGGLGIEVLSPAPEIEETLRRWGVRSLRELAALPAEGVVARLGPDGARLHKLASGSGDRPLFPATASPVFEESLELEYPATSHEPLLFLFGRLLQPLLARLESWGLAANELRLRLRLENQAEYQRTFRLPFPMRDQKTFLKLLHLDLETHPPGAPVVAAALEARPARPRSLQHGLFVPPAPEPQKLELTLARIARLVGESNVGAPELVDTHRPGAFRIKRFESVSSPSRRITAQAGSRLALRVFRPPLAAEVEAAAGRPGRITARRLRGTVVSAAGPWRSSGDWWTRQPWSREEWDVALSDGALYRVYRDRQSNSWVVEGSYD